MTRSIHVGCAALPPRVSRAAYFAAADFVECSLWFDGPVKSATWKKWLDESPEDSLGVVVPLTPLAVPLAPEVGAIVIATPPAFSPSAHNRDRLTKFFAETLPAEKVGAAARVWRPSGLWDLPTALKAARDAGVVLSWDPFGDPTTPASVYESVSAEAMYWRPSGLGRKGPLSPDHLDRLAALSEALPTVWIVLATAEPWKDVRRLRELVQPTQPTQK